MSGANYQIGDYTLPKYVDGMHARLLHRWFLNYTNWCINDGLEEARSRIHGLTHNQLIELRKLIETRNRRLQGEDYN